MALEVSVVRRDLPRTPQVKLRDQIIEELDAKVKAAEQKVQDMEVENSELKGQLAKKDGLIEELQSKLQAQQEKIAR